MDNFRGRRAQSYYSTSTTRQFTTLMPIELHYYYSYQPGRCVARTRLCPYIRAACNKCGFNKKKGLM
jgi:hypothetical protein